MSTPKPEPVMERPIRDLICPGLETPIPHGDIGPEHRRCHRFARHLPATITADGVEDTATCVDIGYGGVGIVASNKTHVVPGQRVDLRIHLGNLDYHDEFSVVLSEHTAEGTKIRLSM